MITVFARSGGHVVEKSDFLRTVGLLAGRAVEPFSAVAIDVLTGLSRCLLSRKDVPQFSALGYWLRPAAINRLKESFFAGINGNQLVAPRGLAFHLPPTNVDTLFVYSWALSLLAGNANVVRLPSSRSADTEWLLSNLIRVSNAAGDGDRHLFCGYDHSLGLNGLISAMSDLRMVWGGDAKINEVSADRLRPDGLSIGFPDRKSFAILAVDAYGGLSPPQREVLAERFYNDTFWFDQMGCGSPRVVAWIGSDEEGRLASDDFYGRVVGIANRKGYRTEAATALAKFSFMNDRLADGGASRGRRLSASLSILELAGESLAPFVQVVGGGMVGHAVLPNLLDVIDLVNRSTQTITHFGFQPDELMLLAKSLRLVGGYRLVPMGRALAFDQTWDGVPLLTHMTRRIVVEMSA